MCHTNSECFISVVARNGIAMYHMCKCWDGTCDGKVGYNGHYHADIELRFARESGHGHRPLQNFHPVSGPVEIRDGAFTIFVDSVSLQVDRGDGRVGLERVDQRQCSRIPNLIAV
jgi:hypothetical protein